MTSALRGTAHLILRFLVPKHYGILSTPVEHLIGIQPAPESIERYLNYIRDLRAIRDKRDFATAAQVDQALWTLQIGVYGNRLDDVAAIKAQHAKDSLLRSIRVKNLADALFEVSRSHPHWPLIALLKDADGLDRVRLGDLDPSRLRHPEARTMVTFAQKLFDRTDGLIAMGEQHFSEVLAAAQLIEP